MLRWILPATAALFWSAAASAADHAVIIGVNTYTRYQPHEKADLLAPESDAQSVKEFARDALGFDPAHIETLLGPENTTRARIMAALDRLPASTSPGDRVLIYFSGHGTQITDLNGDEGDGLDEALMPSDSRAMTGPSSNLLLDDDIDALLRRLEGRRVTLVIDACHSGTLTRAIDEPAAVGVRTRFLPAERDAARPATARVVRPALQDASISGTPMRDVALWAAVSPAELAVEVGKVGLFTKHFLEGLRGAADANGDGLISGAELLRHTRRKSAEDCDINRLCARTRMTPQLFGPAAVFAEPVLAPIRRRPPKPADVLVSGAQGGTLGVSPVDARRGDTLRFTLSHPKGGRFALFDILETGEVTQIFPYPRERRDVRLRPGVAIVYPDQAAGFRYVAESGRGEFVAVVAHDETPALTRDLAVGPSPAADFEALAQGLFETWVGGEHDGRPGAWSVLRVPYDFGD